MLRLFVLSVCCLFACAVDDLVKKRGNSKPFGEPLLSDPGEDTDDEGFAKSNHKAEIPNIDDFLEKFTYYNRKKISQIRVIAFKVRFSSVFIILKHYSENFSLISFFDSVF